MFAGETRVRDEESEHCLNFMYFFLIIFMATCSLIDRVVYKYREIH